MNSMISCTGMSFSSDVLHMLTMLCGVVVVVFSARFGMTCRSVLACSCSVNHMVVLLYMTFSTDALHILILAMGGGGATCGALAVTLGSCTLRSQFTRHCIAHAGSNAQTNIEHNQAHIPYAMGVAP